MATSSRINKHHLIQQFIHYLSAEKNASPHTCRAYERDLEEFENFIRSSGISLSTKGDIEMEKVD
ncbi:MAG: site-specific integrase, partial [Desulfobacterales bacterium]|nr:site-specific integrase [Desulfobacterales bacterium]